MTADDKEHRGGAVGACWPAPDGYTIGRSTEIVNTVFACSDHGHAVRVVALLIDGGFVPRPSENPGTTDR